jgi:hypothetical protein
MQICLICSLELGSIGLAARFPFSPSRLIGTRVKRVANLVSCVPYHGAR